MDTTRTAPSPSIVALMEREEGRLDDGAEARRVVTFGTVASPDAKTTTENKTAVLPELRIKTFKMDNVISGKFIT